MAYASPFHERMVALNETWKYKDWAGITSPCRYIENHVYEYTAFRQSAGMIDVTPLYKYELRGKDAARLLSLITVKDVTKLKSGRVTYLCWCDDDGKVVDDGTVTRLGDDWLRMTAAEPQYAWLTSLATGFDVQIEDISRTMAALAVQGPTSRKVLEACVDGEVASLKFFGSVPGKISGKEVRVSRTGYTGDLGYEIWCKNEDALAVWDAITVAGRNFGLVAAGLDALDIARIEAGFVLLGIDYFSSIHVTVPKKKSSPFEIGLDWTVELDREPFVGQRALLAEKKNGGPKRTLIGLELDWVHLEQLYLAKDLAPQLPAGASRESLPIYVGGRQVGRVSSSTWSPTLKKYLAIGTVDSEYAKEGTELDVEHTVLFERRLAKARVVKKPFFDPERKEKAMTYDAIIIGGGHNGLTAAAYLARAGRKVLVLERRHILGGAAVSEEIFKGFTYSACSYVVSLLRPTVIRELELPRFGLQILPLETTFNPLLDGRYLLRGKDPETTYRSIAQFSKRDADIAPLFSQAMAELSRLVKPIIDRPAPDPASLHPKELFSLLRLGRVFKDAGEDFVATQVKMMTMSAVDFLSEWFEGEPLISAMSASGIIGTFLGVRSPGTAYVLLHHYMGEIDGAFRAWGLPQGGTGQVSMSIARSAEHHGATMRTSAPVERLLLQGDRAVGVVLEGGEEIRAKTVVSGCDPRLTFLGFVGEKNLDAEFVRQIKRYKLRGSSGKVNLALDRLPSFACLPGQGLHLKGDITVAPSIDFLEQAYDDAKYGAFSRRPFMNIVIPSLTDPSVAPPGKHVMSIFVQYAPYHLKEGADKWPEQREAFGDAVCNMVEELCPGFKDSILHRHVLTPWDLEKTYGLSEGNIFHGELSLEQLAFFRPAPGWSRYKTPIRNLWLCGSGAHPGGGVMAGPGWLCAQAMLEERAV